VSLYRTYCNELFQQFGYRANWTPGNPLELGNVGYIERDVFHRLFSLGDRDIRFEPLPGPGANYSYRTANALTISAKAAGQPVPPGSLLATAEAGVIVTFSRATALLFDATGVTNTLVKDREALGQEIISRQRHDQWKPEFLVVTETVKADSATIAVSGGSNGVLEMRAAGALPAGVGNLSSVNANFQATARTCLGLSVVAEKGLTLLYKVCRLRTPMLFGGSKFALQGYDPLDTLTGKEIRESNIGIAMEFSEWLPQIEE